MRVVEYVVFHPWKSAFALVIGVVLGVSSFFVYQVQAAFESVAVEAFDPESARRALEAIHSEDDSAIFVEPSEFESGFIPFDFDGELADIRELLDLGVPFDPREFSPYSFGEPIADELFAAYLLVGTDASGFLADSIILALQPAGGGSPIMVSLPRDLFVWNVCKGTFTRLNAGLGGCSGVATGMEMMAVLVEEYTGIPIDHMARIDFTGFVKVVDALGGTTICVDYPTRDPKSGLDITEAGCANANGKTTLAWVRSRRTEQLIDGAWALVGGSDYTRQTRQQDVLFQLAGKAAGFSSPGSLTDKLAAIASSVRLDSGWTFGQAIAVGWEYRGISKSSVSRFSISVRNYVTPGGAAVLLPVRAFKDQLAAVYPLG